MGKGCGEKQVQGTTFKVLSVLYIKKKKKNVLVGVNAVALTNDLK